MVTESPELYNDTEYALSNTHRAEDKSRKQIFELPTRRYTLSWTACKPAVIESPELYDDTKYALSNTHPAEDKLREINIRITN